MNVITSDVTFIKSHSKYMLPLGFVYLIVNFIGTKIIGMPVYPFLSWTDIKSPIIGIALVVVGRYNYDVVFWAISKLSRRHKSTPDI